VTPFRSRWLPGALVAAATFAVFLPALGGGFVNWDDDENFLWNPHYRGLGWREIRWMFTAVHQGLYIPVTWLTLGLDHIVWLVTTGVILARRPWPAGCVIWGSYVALVAPVLGLLHSGPQVAADRYSYLACMPFALLAGAGLTWVRRRAAERRIAPLVGWAAVAGAAGFLVVLSGLTTAQARVWRDSVTLWEHATAVQPESDIPVFYLGWALADAGRLDEARNHFTRSLARAPENLPEYAQQRRYTEALDAFAEALRVEPSHREACRNGLLAARQVTGRRPELDRCRETQP
jgi:hypothetical protein